MYNVAAAIHFARLGRLGSFLRAKIAALVGLPRMFRKRAAIQRARTATAGEIWSHLERRWLATKLREKRFDTEAAHGAWSR